MSRTLNGAHSLDEMLKKCQIFRLRKEVEDWKSKSNKMQMELNQLKAQYKGLEIKVQETCALWL